MVDPRLRQSVTEVMATLTMLEAQAQDILDTVANERAALQGVLQLTQQDSPATIKIIGVVT